MPARIGQGLAVLSAVAAAFSLAASPVLAFHDQGTPWPGHVITFHNDLPVDAAVIAAAVHDWNTSGASVRFVAAPASSAEVTILPMPAIPLTKLERTNGGGSADALGFATVGAVPRTAPVRPPSGGGVVYGAHVWLAKVGVRDRYGVRIAAGTMERIAVHELGHILGLGHEHRACAVMQPILNEGCGIGRRYWMGLCHDPLEPDDIRGAVSLYGGREPTFHERLCVISPLPGAPRRVSVRLTDNNLRSVVRWRNPRGVTLKIGHRIDPYALDGHPTVEAYQIQGSLGSCPRGRRHVLERELTHSGSWTTAGLPLSPGAWCLEVRALDWFGRLGRPITVRVTVPQPGEPAAPVPNFQFAPAAPQRGQTIAFHNQSTAGAAPITSWSWSFGDGSRSTLANPRHSYANPGSYTVTLLVTDSSGAPATITQRIDVA
jgi:hypothetical protein